MVLDWFSYPDPLFASFRVNCPDHEALLVIVVVEQFWFKQKMLLESTASQVSMLPRVRVKWRGKWARSRLLPEPVRWPDGENPGFSSTNQGFDSIHAKTRVVRLDPTNS